MILRLMVCVSGFRKRDKVECEVKNSESDIKDWIVKIGKSLDVFNLA